MNRRFLFLVLFVCAAGALSLAYVFQQRLATTAEFDHQLQLAKDEAARIREQVILPTEKKIVARENFTAALQKFGLSAEEAANASAAAQHAYNLRQVRAGNTITVGRSVEGTLREIDYKIDADRMLKIVPNDRGFSAQVREIPSKMEIVAVTGRVDDSLFNAVEDAGESAELAMRLAQIFGYDLDFYTDPRKGDTFRIVLEKKKYANGQTAGYGKILAAEYENGGKKYQALLFHDPDGTAGILFGGWKVTTEGVSPLAAEIRRTGDIPFQPSALPPHFENLSSAHGHGLRRSRRHSGANDRQRPRGLCGPQGRRRQHGASLAHQRLRDDVLALVAHVCAQRRAHRNRQDYRSGRQHRPVHRPAPGFPHFAKRPVQEFRKARPAAIRSRFEEEFAGICRGARKVASAISRIRRCCKPAPSASVPVETH